MIDLVIKKTDLKPKQRGQWNAVKDYAGCYVFTYKDKIIYVGRSGDLYSRLISHYSNGGICNAFLWDSIHIIFCENHYEMEKYLIKKLKPQRNGSLTSGIYKVIK